MTMMTEDDFAALYHELAVEFVAEIMQVTYGADTTAAFQQALQTYVDELRPWLCERDVPETVRSTFSLLMPVTNRSKPMTCACSSRPKGTHFFMRGYDAGQ